ncbi:hypothetical protein GGF32_005341 [Allomyces javanicus]|nr:hypothetical protein GGF32_005341 [Allomyces javanicus]
MLVNTYVALYALTFVPPHIPKLSWIRQNFIAQVIILAAFLFRAGVCPGLGIALVIATVAVGSLNYFSGIPIFNGLPIRVPMAQSLKTLKYFGGVDIGGHTLLASPDGIAGQLVDTDVIVRKGTVTQTTSATTGVTLHYPAGVITTVSLTNAAGTTTSFTFSNSYIKASSVVLLQHSYGSTLGSAGLPMVTVNSVGNGSCTINVTNLHGSNALNGAIKIHFFVV